MMHISQHLFILLTLSCAGCYASYSGQPGEPHDDQHGESSDLDPHSKEFCVDVSEWGPVYYVDEEREMCTTEFVEETEVIEETVDVEVTDCVCTPLAYTECEIITIEKNYTVTKPIVEIYDSKMCEEEEKWIKHEKMIPKCRNVTKLNCVTLWETDPLTGKQQWAGNQNCEPVTWQECKLVPIWVDFKIPVMNCNKTTPIPYDDCTKDTKTKDVCDLKCIVKTAVNCKSRTRIEPATVSWIRRWKEPQTTCKPKIISKPTQDKIHKKKCLLEHDNQSIQNHPEIHAHTDSEHPDHSSGRSGRDDSFSDGSSNDEEDKGIDLRANRRSRGRPGNRRNFNRNRRGSIYLDDLGLDKDVLTDEETPLDPVGVNPKFQAGQPVKSELPKLNDRE